MSSVRHDLAVVTDSRGLVAAAARKPVGSSKRRGGAVCRALMCAAVSGACFGESALGLTLPTFSLTTFDLSARLSRVSAGDFNNDGLSDIVLFHTSSSSAYLPATVYFNNPANPGTFHNPMVLGFSSASACMAYDINRDGWLDTIVVSESGVWAAFGNPPGSSNPSQPFVAIGGAIAGPWSIGDFNHDGWPDCVSGKYVYFNSAAANPGYFGGAIDIDPTFTTQAPYSMAGDFNGDGWSDIALFTIELAKEGVYTYINNGDGTFHFLEKSTTFRVQSFVGQYCVGADFNHDGRSDIVTASMTGSVGQTSVFALLSKSASPTGQMTNASNLGGLTSPLSLSSTDFNLDGELDLLESGLPNNDSGILMLLGNPPPLAGIGFTQMPLLPVPAGNGLVAAVGDFNGDGKPDIVSVQNLAAAPNRVYVYLNTTPRAAAPCPADLNHDMMVDDADFVIFVKAYDELMCPE